MHRTTVLILLSTALGPGGLLAAAANKLPVDVTAAVDKQRVTIGDVISYQVEVTAPLGATVSLPDAEKRLAPFEVRDYNATQNQAQGKLHVTYSFQVAVFQLGDQELRGLEVQYRLPRSTATHTVKVPPVRVNVASVLPPDAKDIMDIRDPVPVQMGAEQWLAAALVALAFLIPLAAAAYLIVRRRRRQPVAAPEKALTAHERALQELELLRVGELLPRGQLKAFYVRMSEIVREYLEARFDIHAMEETTWMIDRDLQSCMVSQECREAFIALLRRADLVKFARHQVTDEEALADLRLAQRSVEATRANVVAQPQETELAAPVSS